MTFWEKNAIFNHTQKQFDQYAYKVQTLGTVLDVSRWQILDLFKSAFRPSFKHMYTVSMTLIQ